MEEPTAGSWAAGAEVGGEPDEPTLELPRPGGSIHYRRWGCGPRVVVAVHGLTANHVCFAPLAERLDPDRYTLLAPDLRGRGRSAPVAGPFGLGAHADDLAALLDAEKVERAVLAGHSMGGFVAVVTAHRHPERVGSLVLIDGGLPLDVASVQDQPIEEVLRSVVGPALDRLELTFETPAAYLDYWRAHPALAAAWSPWAERTYRYDLTGRAPRLRSSVNGRAVLDDAASQLASDTVERALVGLAHPATLLRAERGLFDQVPPLYPDAQVAIARRTVPHLRVVDAPGLNHYTLVLTDQGADLVAQVVAGAGPDGG
jgi:lipase